MLRVLIVDDEPFFLDFMADFLTTQTESCEIVDAVSDGLKAMAVLREKTVDVIFTDIKMPVMDGLELICSAMELNPEYQFVVLSSYSEFSMVGEAFKLGAKEYALKSEITEEQMTDILRHCDEHKQKIFQEREKNYAQKKRFSEMSEQLNLLQHLVDSSRNELKKKFFKGIFTKDITILDAYNEQYAQTFLPEQPPCSVMMMRIHDCHRIISDTWHGDYPIFEFALNNILGEICENFSNTVFFCNGADEYLLLTAAEGGEVAQKCRLQELFRVIKETLQQSLMLETILSAVSVGVCGGTLRELYIKVASRNKAFFFLGKEQLLCEGADAGEGERVAAGEGLVPMATQFWQLLSAKNVTEIQENISSYQVSAQSVSVGQSDEVREQFVRYAFYLKEYAADINDTERVQDGLNYFNQYLKCYGTLEEMNEWLVQMLTVFLQQEYHSSSLVKRAKKYILAHYHEDISLTGIAGVMEVSGNYLSRVFSKEYGDSLISYLNLIRIQAAAKLLKESNLKNYEIAEKVGYQNVEHFSRIFKKLTGKTPGEYRNEGE